MSVTDQQKRIQNLDSHNLALRTQIKDQEDKIGRYENWYNPRLKETQKFQKEIFEELEKIRQDAELLPSMFRAEAQFRIECKREKDEAVEKMTSALK